MLGEEEGSEYTRVYGIIICTQIILVNKIDGGTKKLFYNFGYSLEAKKSFTKVVLQQPRIQKYI